jgi:cytochrome c6
MEQEDAAEADEGEEETADSPPAIDAAALFDANCARCHGADRVSGGAPDLVPDQLTKDREVYIGTITNGSGPMPAWGSQLSADEINALVDFILSTPE